ncbi:MAG: hypothetical protein FGM41_12510 [Bacteroidetes bacterium]|nr:hypothetical protein [Bacteroidota bacterium]
MKEKEASVEISRDESGTLLGLKLFMPVWVAPRLDGTFDVKLPLLAISIDAFSEDDIDVAIKEVTLAFAKSAEKFGNGLEKEIIALGWKHDKGKSHKNLFSVTSKNLPFPSMIKTGQPMAFQLAI